MTFVVRLRADVRKRCFYCGLSQKPCSRHSFFLLGLSQKTSMYDLFDARDS